MISKIILHKNDSGREVAVRYDAIANYTSIDLDDGIHAVIHFRPIIIGGKTFTPKSFIAKESYGSVLFTLNVGIPHCEIIDENGKHYMYGKEFAEMV